LCNRRSACTDGTGHRTNGTRCAGIIRRIPRGQRKTGLLL